MVPDNKKRERQDRCLLRKKKGEHLYDERKKKRHRVIPAATFWERGKKGGAQVFTRRKKKTPIRTRGKARNFTVKKKEEKNHQGPFGKATASGGEEKKEGVE